MTLEEIKAAVDAGKTVHWENTLYTVKKNKYGDYDIVCSQNGYTIGLTWQDGVTMNGHPEQFFVAKYIVFNLTDGIIGPFPYEFETAGEAKAAIEKWRADMKAAQGYYLTSDRQRIDVDDVYLEVMVPSEEEDDDDDDAPEPGAF